MSLHHTTAQRLAFVKYLYLLGEGQSRLSEIHAGVSILMFHDAIEMFLQIASEELNVGKANANFLDYWGFFSGVLKEDLPQKESMRRLNKARVGLKHAGTLPAKIDIESFRIAADSFFKEATPLIFKVEFADISLIDYVNPEAARDHLHAAQANLLHKEFESASTQVALAFEKMIDHYVSNASRGRRGHAFDFGPSMTFLSSFHLGLERGGEFGEVSRFVDTVKSAVESMQRALLIVSLGLDYKKYSLFRSKLPIVSRIPPNSYITHHLPYFEDTAPDSAYIAFCIDYVIECAIRINEPGVEVSGTAQP
jgi:hypothetical protein